MSNNLFGEMIRPSMMNAEGIGDINGRLVLVEVVAGLTNYTHTPYSRQPSPYLPSNLMEELVLETRRGSVTPTMVENYSAHMGGLNNVPKEASRIQGGWNEYNKGLMKMKFKIQNGGMSEEYISVLGYITGNDSDNSLSENATFTPTFSWRHSAMMHGSVGLDNMSFVTEKIGRRTDYLLNDGSHSSTKGLVSMRPADIMTSAGDVIAQNDIMQRAQMEGIETSGAVPSYGSGSINHVGIVLSNRGNYNPTKYSNKLLAGALKANRSKQYGDQSEERLTSSYSSELSMISTVSSNMLDAENKPSEDEFLVAMRDAGSLRNLRGWRIGQIADMFPTFEDAIPRDGFRLLDRSEFDVVDFSEITQVFGTSSNIETIAQEIVFNILDLLVANGLSMINFRGSNCEEMATEDSLSNIHIVPHNSVSLSENDTQAAIKGINLCEDLKHQIFKKLNGAGVGNMTPLTFRVEAELMGNTKIWLINPSSESNGAEIYWSFPTYAPNPYSPIFGDNESIAQLSSSVYSNIRSYLND